MTSVIEFFEMYNAWIIAGVIIILLAIIGRYADKTNFGQNKKGDEPSNQKDASENLNSDVLENNAMFEQSQPIDEVSNDQENLQQLTNQSDTAEIKNEDNQVNNETISMPIEEKNIDSETKYEQLDKELDSLLPKKEIIDEDLLEDINNLSLDKTQKINVMDIPDLDDVDLPEIKNLNQQDEDIWKF